MRLRRDGAGKRQELGENSDSSARGSLHSRRCFCKAASALVLAAANPWSAFAEWSEKQAAEPFDVVAIDRSRVLAEAQRYLRERPITVTASASERSPGGKHDYFSEADYFWPDPKNPFGPYISRDGMSNPENFQDHRRFLLRFSVQAAALTAAWRITQHKVYAEHATEHLRAWFMDTSTRMSPNLQYSQAIRGSATGSRFGVIDTIHLVEVARAVELLANSGALSLAEVDDIKLWFADYLQWMTTSNPGLEERAGKNNHGTCWTMQVASFARLTENRDLMSYTRERFKAVLVPDQMAADGSFPLEEQRTKPYGYSLFNLDAMSAICQILSGTQENLWAFELSDGRGIRKAVAFMAPFIQNKSRWPFPPDVMYDKDWPMRQCALLFAGLAFNRPDYLALWKTLPAESNVEEVTRNFFIRQPVLWVDARS